MKHRSDNRTDSKAAASVHETILTLIQKAIECLKTGGDDESVHAARKLCKRIRAGLRLMRQCYGEERYDQENRCIRDAAQPLTHVRDGLVLRNTLDGLDEPAPALRQILLREYQQHKKEFDNEGRRIALGNLRQSLARLQGLVPASSERISARVGVRKTYKAGRSAFSNANGAEDEELHEWRKQTKYLVYELEIVHAVFGTTLKRRKKAARSLAQVLGDDHDLAVLAQVILARRLEPGRLEPLIKDKRVEFQRKAMSMGRKLYRSSPSKWGGKLARRLEPA